MSIEVNDELEYLMLRYDSALKVLQTQLEILGDEFKLTHKYNPIEHIKTRLKTMESITAKLNKKGYEFSIQNIEQYINDVVGARIVCSFKNDVYSIVNVIKSSDIITVLDEKDYIENPKTSGYSSYHLIVTVPVTFTTGTASIKAEIQIRTMAMDFWASLDHKLNYKYDGRIPDDVISELMDASNEVNKLDDTMSKLVDKLNKYNSTN